MPTWVMMEEVEEEEEEEVQVDEDKVMKHQVKLGVGGWQSHAAVSLLPHTHTQKNHTHLPLWLGGSGVCVCVWVVAGGLCTGALGVYLRSHGGKAEISPAKSTRLISSVNHWIFHRCGGGAAAPAAGDVLVTRVTKLILSHPAQQITAHTGLLYLLSTRLVV